MDYFHQRSPRSGVLVPQASCSPTCTIPRWLKQLQWLVLSVPSCSLPKTPYVWNSRERSPGKQRVSLASQYGTGQPQLSPSPVSPGTAHPSPHTTSLRHGPSNTPQASLCCTEHVQAAEDTHGAAGAGPEEAPATIRGLEPLCWEERLGELGLLGLGSRRLQEDLTAGFQYFKGLTRKLGTGFLAGPVAIGQGVMVLNKKRRDSA